MYSEEYGEYSPGDPEVLVTIHRCSHVEIWNDGELEKDGIALTPSPIQYNGTPVKSTSSQAVVHVDAPSASFMIAKEFKALKNQPLFVVMDHFGYANTKAVRRGLAQHFAIPNYLGSRA